MTARLRVKLVSSQPTSTWLHQFPGNEPVWGECQFLFDRDAAAYDWLVVYDDVSARAGEAKRSGREPLHCPAAHTLLVTTEPSSIKIYGDDYTRQFGAVLTSQSAAFLPHRQRVYSQSANHWFYGLGSRAVQGFDAIQAQTPAAKQHDVSMVHSNKAMRHTLHYHRARFMHELARRMPEIDLFGRHSPRPLDDKADCLRAYRYHIAIENFIGMHHWTEKIADPFLGLSLPFYCGCPNLEDYFPTDSFIRIDILDPAGAVEIIRAAIANGEYAKRVSSLAEARRRVMFEYNLFAVLAREISRLHDPAARSASGAIILSRRAMRLSGPGTLMRDLYGKLRGRLCHLPGAISGRS